MTPIKHFKCILLARCSSSTLILAMLFICNSSFLIIPFSVLSPLCSCVFACVFLCVVSVCCLCWRASSDVAGLSDLEIISQPVEDENQYLAPPVQLVSFGYRDLPLAALDLSLAGSQLLSNADEDENREGWVMKQPNVAWWAFVLWNGCIWYLLISQPVGLCKHARVPLCVCPWLNPFSAAANYIMFLGLRRHAQGPLTFQWNVFYNCVNSIT